MMTLTPMTSASFKPTEKHPGDRVLALHRVHIIDDRGGVEPDPIAPIPGPAPVLVNSQWPATPVWALMGLLMGILVVWGICS